MLDTPTPAAQCQRSHGAAVLHLGAAGRIDALSQAGSAKVFLHRAPAADLSSEAVFLNTSGGLTGGDRLAFDMALVPGARLTATTQTAERAYRSTGPAAHVRVTASVGPGARLDWLPQETILFEGAHLLRETEILLAADAGCLLAETVILGRHAMGEHPARARLTDRRRVLRDGRPVWHEALGLGPEALAAAGGAATFGGARAFAVVALIAPGAEDAVGPVRAALGEPGVEAAASGFDGRCLVRLMARDGWPLRRQLVRVLAALRPGPLPRVWQM